MLAYKETLLENTFLAEEAKSLYKAGFINKQQNDFIHSELKGYHKQNNILIRIGLFILGCFLYSSCCGLFAFITLLGGNDHYAWPFFVYALFGFLSLEFMIRRWNYYANGLDDAFLVSAQLCLIVCIGFLANNFNYLSFVFLITSLIGTLCCLCYADQFSALIAYIGITAFVVRVFLQAGDSLKLFLPFVMMLFAVGMYRLYLFLKHKSSAYTWYTKSLNLCFVLTLLLFYFSGNYFVVRETSTELMGISVMPGHDIPLAFLFYGFTFLTPLVYIYFSLVKKNRILLWTGLITFGLSILTIRYYYSVIPTDIALLLGGFLLFVIAFFSMRKLKGKTGGLTFEPDRFTSTETLLNVEALALIKTYSGKADAGNSPDIQFGGGEFGGGGSGSNY